MRSAVREKVGAIAAPKDIRFVSSLPRDRHGRHMRAVFKAVYDGVELTGTPTLDVDASPAEIRAAVEAIKKAVG